MFAAIAKRLPLLLLPLFLLWFSAAPNALDHWLPTRLIWAAAPAASSDIVIVAIDEKSLAQLGRWPWPRQRLAAALDRLGNARAVGLNIVLAEPSAQPAADQALADAIRRHGRVYLPVIPEIIDGQPIETAPLPLFAAAARGVGVSDYPLDGDGTIRSTALAAGVGRAHLPSFAALVAGRHVATDHRTAPQAGWQRQQLRLLPALAAGSAYPELSISALLAASGPLAALQDKTVFIGVTAAGLGDRHHAAVHPDWRESSGVMLNAAVSQAAMQRTLVAPLPAAWRLAGLLTVSLIWLLWHWRRPGSSPLRSAAAAIATLLLAEGMLAWGWQQHLGSSTLCLLLALAALAELLWQQRRYRLLALTDKLTGLANRHLFDERIVQVLAKARQQQRPLALLLVDVDYFKRYNDYYGHAAGDDVLRQIGALMRSVIDQRQQLAARIGGEEFALLLPGTDQRQAMQIASALRQRLLQRQLPHQQSPLGRLSCSIGVLSRVPDSSDSVRSLFEAADHALYLAKNSGRDSACFAEMEQELHADMSAD